MPNEMTRFGVFIIFISLKSISSLHNLGGNYIIWSWNVENHHNYWLNVITWQHSHNNYFWQIFAIWWNFFGKIICQIYHFFKKSLKIDKIENPCVYTLLKQGARI
jgi:hypothetical protein